MLTETMIRANAELSRTAPFSRRGGDDWKRLTAHLVKASNGTCAGCGERFVDIFAAMLATGDLSGAVQILHVSPSLGKDRGYFAGNLYAGCKRCNDEDRLTYGGTRPIHAYARPELIDTTWTWASI